MYKRVTLYLLNWEENVVYIRKNKTWNDKTKEALHKVSEFYLSRLFQWLGQWEKKVSVV